MGELMLPLYFNFNAIVVIVAVVITIHNIDVIALIFYLAVSITMRLNVVIVDSFGIEQLFNMYSVRNIFC